LIENLLLPQADEVGMKSITGSDFINCRLSLNGFNSDLGFKFCAILLSLLWHLFLLEMAAILHLNLWLE
jgi:hypothetical protein